MVLTFDVIHAEAFDAEDGQALAAYPPDLDVAQLAAAHKPKRPQEEVLGLEHCRLPLIARPWTGGGDPAKVGSGPRWSLSLL